MKTLENPEMVDSTNHQNKYLFFIAAIVFAVFVPALNNNFINLDDQLYVYQNDAIIHPNFSNFKKLLSGIVAGNYHPIAMISLFLNSLIFGQKAFGFILVNLILNAINAVLVYKISLKLAKNSLISLFVAIAWGIHPMHVEVVVWVSERKDLLCTLFYLWGMLTYADFLEKGEKLAFLKTFLFFVLACLSRATAVTFPVALVLLEYWYDKPFWSFQYLKSKIAFLSFSGLIIWISSHAQSGRTFYGFLTEIGEPTKALGSTVYTFTDNVFFASYGFCIYLTKAIIPINLHHFYPYPLANAPKDSLLQIAPLLLILFLISSIIAFKKGYKLFVFGTMFFFFSILPVLKFIPIGATILSERYTYLPYFGLFFTLFLILEKYAKYFNYLLFPLLAFFAFQTFMYSRVWKSTLSLWENNYNYVKNDFLASNTLVQMYKNEEKASEIIEICEELKNQGYIHPVIFENLATSYYMLGDKAKSLEHYNKAIEFQHIDNFIKLDKVNAYSKRGFVLRDLGELNLSNEDFSKAISMDTSRMDLVLFRSQNNLKLNKIPEVIKDYDILIAHKYHPLDTLYNDRGGYKYNLGDKQGAIADFKHALEVNKSFKQARENLDALDVK